MDLTNLVEQLGNQLAYFSSLEPAVKLLSASGEDVCLDPAFAPNLEKIDQCISFMEANVFLIWSMVSVVHSSF